MMPLVTASRALSEAVPHQMCDGLQQLGLSQEWQAIMPSAGQRLSVRTRAMRGARCIFPPMDTLPRPLTPEAIHGQQSSGSRGCSTLDQNCRRKLALVQIGQAVGWQPDPASAGERSDTFATHLLPQQTMLMGEIMHIASTERKCKMHQTQKNLSIRTKC
jgi:hypothetical protein